MCMGGHCLLLANERLASGGQPVRMESKYTMCQSCGMPLKRDPKGGGTNADGSKSTMYCSHCYEAGKFTAPDMTAAGMQAFAKMKMKEMGFPGFMAGLFAKKIPKLARWNRA